MQPVEFLRWLETTPVGVTVSQALFGFSALDMVHVAAIAVAFGMIAVVDLRLLGIASMDRPVTEVLRQALPWTWVAFGIAVLTGVLMFTGQAVKYYNNYALRMKLLLLLVAGINMLVFQLITYRGVAKWDKAGVPLSARLAGAISLACWIAIVAYGRWTAYYMF
jgi:hypothetical protein